MLEVMLTSIALWVRIAAAFGGDLSTLDDFTYGGGGTRGGTYQAALEIAHTCETPTSWVERDQDGYWFAMCGTSDGRTCGVDVSWDHVDCDGSPRAPEPVVCDLY